MLALGYADLPAIDAILNFCATLMIVSGLIAVKRGKLAWHKGFMITGLLFSVAFLCCYLSYHFGPVPAKRFEGEGIGRVLYLAMLFSHILLAALIVPLVLLTVYRGLRDQREAHKKIARITAPLWLYVSVTGVLIYLVLYQF